MFVQPAEGQQLDNRLREQIRVRIRTGVSRGMQETGDLVKRLIQGTADPLALPLGGMSDPGLMQWYIDFAAAFRAHEQEL
jgi:hypothetical protein